LSLIVKCTALENLKKSFFPLKANIKQSYFFFSVAIMLWSFAPEPFDKVSDTLLAYCKH
jgi:hypothetical protein